MKDITKLANFVDSELDSSLKDVLLSRDSSGKYYLFGKYAIINHKHFYKVYCIKSKEIVEFSSLKNATAFCVLQNAGKRLDAKRVMNLDLRLTSIDVDIAVHKNKIRNSKTTFDSTISITKLQEDTYKRRVLLAELNDYINNSKRIQDNNFRSKDSKIKHLR